MWAYLGHLHLRCPATADHARILHGLLQHAQRVVQGALSLVQHVGAYRQQVQQGSNSHLQVGACSMSITSLQCSRPSTPGLILAAEKSANEARPIAAWAPATCKV